MGFCRGLAVVAVCLLSVVASHPAVAGETADFDTALANAWAHCRDALFQSAPSHANKAATAEALAAFNRAWAGLAERWDGHPPPQYAEDQDFAQELAAIADVSGQASARARQGHITQAHALLLQVPVLLAEMRRKNGLEQYTDHLDAFAEQLAEITDDVFDRSELSPPQVVVLIKQIAVLGYLGERMEKRAPARLTEDEAFLALVEDINAQLRGLEAAALAGQRVPVVAALSDLRGAFERLYRLYG